MSDNWIDKNELNQLVSGIGQQPQGPVYGPQSDDLFYDVQPEIVATNHPAQNYLQPQQASAAAIPLQVLVNQQQQQQAVYQAQLQQQQQIGQIEQRLQSQPMDRGFSPFSLDETEPEDPTQRIARLEMLLEELKSGKEQVADTDLQPEEDVPEEECESELPINDRIPLDVEIDRYLSLKGRLACLADILGEYVNMEQMMVVDQNGLSLFETKEVNIVENKANGFLAEISKVFTGQEDRRNHSVSQLVLEEDKWLLLMPTDGKGIEKKYVLKCLLTEPLDRPELYTLIELLNEAMRPEKA